MRVLVTGAAGFIGSKLVDRLLRDGRDVVAVDDLSTGRRVNLAAHPRLEVHQLDVCLPDFARLAEGVEVICHLAAQTSVSLSVKDPLNDARLNVVGTASVLESARLAGVRKTVFTSSAAVYGRPTALPVTGSEPMLPMSPYGASKASGELYLAMYQSLYGLEYTSLILSNVYGPRQSPEGEAGVVAIFTDAMLRGEPTVVFGDGSHTRDYVFVEDVVDAFVLACGSSGNGGRYNIGTGIETADRRLHTLVAEAVGVPDTPASAPFRPGDLPAMVMDPAPARAELGWVPRTELHVGLKATIEWARTANA